MGEILGWQLEDTEIHKRRIPKTAPTSTAPSNALLFFRERKFPQNDVWEKREGQIDSIGFFLFANLSSPLPSSPPPQTLTLFPVSPPIHHLPGTSLSFLFCFNSKDPAFFRLSFHCFPLFSRAYLLFISFFFYPFWLVFLQGFFRVSVWGSGFWVNFLVGCVFDL